jgi:hypothetical protein
MDKNYQTDMIVLDFAKAFDKVSHPRLLHKLEHYGIHGNNKNWIKSFLNNRTQAVALENLFLLQFPVVGHASRMDVSLLFLLW